MENVSPVFLAIARKRVARGVRWLDQRAKIDPRFVGWRLQMMWIIDGRVVSLVKIYNNTDDPLSLALKWEENLASVYDGRVKWATVAPEFGFAFGQGCLKALYLGFHEGHGSSSWYEETESLAYSYALNKAWEEALSEHRVPLTPRLFRTRFKAGAIPARIGLVEALRCWWNQKPVFA